MYGSGQIVWACTGWTILVSIRSTAGDCCSVSWSRSCYRAYALGVVNLAPLKPPQLNKPIWQTAQIAKGHCVTPWVESEDRFCTGKRIMAVRHLGCWCLHWRTAIFLLPAHNWSSNLTTLWVFEKQLWFSRLCFGTFWLRPSIIPRWHSYYSYSGSNMTYKTSASIPAKLLSATPSTHLFIVDCTGGVKSAIYYFLVLHAC